MNQIFFGEKFYETNITKTNLSESWLGLDQESVTSFLVYNQDLLPGGETGENSVKVRGKRNIF